MQGIAKDGEDSVRSEDGGYSRYHGPRGGLAHIGGAILEMKMQDMTQHYRKLKRAWGMWHAFDTATGNSVSLNSTQGQERERIVRILTETEPGFAGGQSKK